MKKIFIISITIILLFVFSICSYAERISNEITNNIFRLHIIANSNSYYDQIMKLRIRDNIVKYYSKQKLTFNSIYETKEYFNNQHKTICNIIESTFKEYNANYDYTVAVCEDYFPTKFYANVSLPCGVYSCLKIKIGSAKGKNWWCMLYPNICLNDLSVSKQSDNILKNSLSNDSYLIITNKKNYSFKCIEIYENIKNKFN